MGPINIHRTYIPESKLGPGILVQSYYELKKELACITDVHVYYVHGDIVGANISEELDIYCHLYITKLVTEELNLL